MVPGVEVVARGSAEAPAAAVSAARLALDPELGRAAYVLHAYLAAYPSWKNALMRVRDGDRTVLEFAQKAFIVNLGRLLLVEKAQDDPEQPGTWDVPGGRLLFDEALDEHIRREVMEEVGLEITPGEPFALWDWRMSGRGEHRGAVSRVVAVGRRCDATSTSLSYDGRTDDDHLGLARWVPLEDVLGYPLIPSLVPAVRELVQR